MPFHSRRWNAAFLSSLLLLGFLAYRPALGFGFVWDDHPLILENERLSPGSSALDAFKGHFWDLGGRADHFRRFYRPLVTLSYWAGLRLSGADPAAFHAANLALHLACAAMAYFLALRFFGGAALPAFAAALVFTLHPSHAENVAWVSGRTDLLAGLFSFAALLLWLRSEERASAWMAGLGCAAYALGLLSKEVALMAAPAWLLFPTAHGRGRLGPWRLKVLGWAALAAGLAWALRAWALSGQAPPPPGPPWLAHAAALGWVGLAYFRLTLLLKPTDPHHYDLRLEMAPPQLAAGLALLLAFGAAAGWLARRGGPAASAAGLFAVFLLPVAGLGSFGDVLYADRFLYLPSLGLGLLLGLAVARAAGLPPAAQLALSALPGLLALPALASSLPRWRDDLALFQSSAATSPDSPLVLNNLGLAYGHAGRWGEAEQAFRRALSLAPDFAYARHNLGLALRRQGRAEAALPEYARALALEKDPLYAFNQAEALAALGRDGEAEASLRRALALRPAYGEAAHNLGQLLLKDKSRRREARELFLLAAGHALRPSISLNSLGILAAEEGDPARARSFFRAALEAEPGYAAALDNLSRLPAEPR